MFGLRKNLLEFYLDKGLLAGLPWVADQVMLASKSDVAGPRFAKVCKKVNFLNLYLTFRKKRHFICVNFISYLKLKEKIFAASFIPLIRYFYFQTHNKLGTLAMRLRVM